MVGFGFPQNEPENNNQSQYPNNEQFNPQIDFSQREKDDLTRYQLDFSQTKSDIAHWLNGDEEVEDDKGKRKWKVNESDEFRVLNRAGIREVMRILSMYLTKDIVLGELESNEIKQIAETLGNELNDLFFTKYDEIGLDTANKKKNYSLIITTIIHNIYIILTRAKEGKERRSVTENRNVQQSEIMYPQGMQQKQSWFGKLMN